jgi:transcriptional regulator with XRE-family HTH domain
VAEQAAPGFGGLLRRLRAEAGLTQEELAKAARLSPRSVSDLERGINRTARKDTARLLADAQDLEGLARAEFEAAARGQIRAVGGPTVIRALPRDVASFTGREASQKSAAAGGCPPPSGTRPAVVRIGPACQTAVAGRSSALAAMRRQPWRLHVRDGGIQ